MGGRIDCYIDITSFFSYIAFTDLCQNADKLKANGVEIDFIPVLIAGINSLSGNKPPWLLPSKAKYLSTDSQRAAKRLGLLNLRTPRDLLSMSMTVSPLRALHFIKVNHPERFIQAVGVMFDKFWTPPNLNLTEESVLEEVLRGLFSEEEEVRGIMAGREGMKKVLKDRTEEVVKLGAFGAPWLWVTNDEGEKEAFFGSDRFNHVYQFLGIPFQDVAVLGPSKL